MNEGFVLGDWKVQEVDRDGDHAVGAVETLKPGRVRLQNELSGAEAEALSCAFVGLMLYQPPSDH